MAQDTSIDRAIKITAIIISLLLAVFGFVYGYGSLNNRVLTVERDQAKVQQELSDMRKEFRDDMAYIRKRLDEIADKKGGR